MPRIVAGATPSSPCTAECSAGARLKVRSTLRGRTERFILQSDETLFPTVTKQSQRCSRRGARWTPRRHLSLSGATMPRTAPEVGITVGERYDRVTVDIPECTD